MKFAGSALVALFVLSTSVGDGADRTSAPPDLSAPLDHPPSVVTGISYPPVQVGDPSPNFTWTVPDDHNHALRDVLQQAHALVVFAPDDEVLEKLESARDELAQIAVVPIAVVDARARSAANRARRLGVHFLVLPDPTHVISAQFNQIDATSGRMQPGWYAVDRRGIVRGAGADLHPDVPWTRIAASALAIPARDGPLPAQAR